MAEGVQYSASQQFTSLRHYSEGAVDLFSRVVRDPSGTLTEGAMFASSAARVLAPASEPMSPVMQGRTLSLEFDLLSVPLADLKAAGKSVGGTLNDAFLAVVSGGLQRYHARHGAPIPDVRVNMPVNMRTDGNSEGNSWVPARFLIPIDIDDPRDRMKVLSPLLRNARSEPALPISDFVMRRLVQLPRGMMTKVAGGLMKGTDVAATNVPGPPIPVFMAGTEVLAFVPFAPKGGAALNVALMSYNGTVFLGVNIDTGAIRDPEVLMVCLQEALDEVVAVGASRSDTGSNQQPAKKHKDSHSPKKSKAKSKGKAKKS